VVRLNFGGKDKLSGSATGKKKKSRKGGVLQRIFGVKKSGVIRKENNLFEKKEIKTSDRGGARTVDIPGRGKGTVAGQKLKFSF